MARNGQVNVDFHGDATQLQKTFDDVGSGARGMAKDIDKATSTSRAGFDSLAEGVDGSESKFRGFGDTITGTGDIMQGFRDGNIAGIAMGFADLAGGISDFVVPALTAMKGAIVSGLAPALTLISAHPLIAGLLAGGAIIAGLILLEKKFGLVSKTVEALKDVFTRVAGFIVEPFRAAFNGIASLWNNTVGKLSFSVPSWVPGIGGKGFEVPDIPRFHTGGIAGRDMLAVLQQGEQVIPRGQTASGGGITINVAGSVITERDLGRIVADALRNNVLIGVT